MKQKLYVNNGKVKEDAFMDHLKAIYNKDNIIDQIEIELLENDLNGREATV